MLHVLIKPKSNRSLSKISRFQTIPRIRCERTLELHEDINTKIEGFNNPDLTIADFDTCHLILYPSGYLDEDR